MNKESLMTNIKWLLGHVARLKAMYALAIVMLAVSAILQLWTVVVQKNIIDDVFVAGEYSKLYPLLSLFVICFLGFVLLEIFGPYVFVKNRSKIERNISFEVLNYLYERIPIRRLHSERTAKYTAMLTSDIMLLANMTAREVPIAVQLIVRIVGLIVVIALSSPILLVFLIGICVLYLLLAKWSTPKAKQASHESVQERTQLQVLLDENISGTREVVSYHRGHAEDERYGSIFGRYFTKLYREGMLNNSQTQIGETIRWGAIAVILAYCGYAVFHDQMSLGTFVLVFQFALQLLVAMQTLFALYLLFSQQIVHAERIRDVMAEEMGQGRLELEESVERIRFQKVKFQYNEHTKMIFDGLTIDIPGGQKVALVGESGCGKSTLLQLIVRFYEPQAGMIQINQTDLPDIDRKHWAKRITCVMQESYFFAGSIRDNLLMGHQALDDEELLGLCELCCIAAYIVQLPNGLDTLIGERGITLSGGERQRLSLVRALVRNSEILILDEATSALDYETERRVQAAMDIQRQGKTTIVIAHRLSTIRNADTIIVLQHGQIIASGTDAELLVSCPLYSDHVSKQTVPA
jgi:ABC-type multidrug transport system fused ATPase/permease subunit